MLKADKYSVNKFSALYFTLRQKLFNHCLGITEPIRKKIIRLYQGLPLSVIISFPDFLIKFYLLQLGVIATGLGHVCFFKTAFQERARRPLVAFSRTFIFEFVINCIFKASIAKSA